MAPEVNSLWYTYPAFSFNGQLLAASFEEEIKIWGTRDWEELVSIPSSKAAGLVFSPDGRLLVVHAYSEPPQLWGVSG